LTLDGQPAGLRHLKDDPVNPAVPLEWQGDDPRAADDR
jgi:hypothetical protein